MSNVTAYRAAVLACALMTLSARSHNQIVLVLVCWIVLGVIHDNVADRAISVHIRKFNKILWMVVASQAARIQRKKLADWLNSDLTKNR